MQDGACIASVEAGIETSTKHTSQRGPSEQRPSGS